MSGLTDFLSQTPAERAAAAAAPKVAPAPTVPQGEATQPVAQPQQIEQQYSGPHVVTDAVTKQPLVEDKDGTIWLHGVGGELKPFAPQEAGALLANKQSGYYAAAPEEVQAHIAKKQWNDADLAAKSDYVARRTLVQIADGLTMAPRLGAKLLGASPKLDEKLSGENLVRQLDAMLAGEDVAAKESQGARELEAGAPGALNLGTDIAGLVLSGGLAGGAGKVAKLAGAGKLAAGLEATSLEGAGKLASSAGTRIATALGMDATKAAKLGSYADTVVQGAAIGNAQAGHEAWIKDEPLTAEAQWQAMGLGALLGAGGHAAIDALRGIPRAGLGAAERVFGKPKVSLGAEDAAAAQDLAESITGVKQPSGLGEKLKDMGDWIKAKVQSAQAEKSGVALKDVENYGFMGEKHKWAEDLSRNRDEIVRQGTKDLHEALDTLHREGSLLADNVVDVAMKREHMARLLEGTDHGAIMQVAKDKAAEFEASLTNLNATVGRGRSMFGGGKQLADIKGAYEDAIDRLGSAEAPADVTSALDQFKRATQRAKVNAEKTAEKVTSGIERDQAFKRADLMEQVSDNTRKLLEDNKLFGGFGDAQRETNARFNRVLDTDKYLKQQFFERTGDVSRGVGFGQSRYELNPAKIESYLDNLGSNRSARADEFLRDNIDARKQLTETLGKYYGSDQAESVKMASDAAEKAMKVLTNMDETVRVTNIRDALLAAEAGAKGHGSAGMTLAAMAGHILASHPVGAAGYAAVKAVSHVLDNPMRFTGQALALRDAAVKLNDSVGKNVEKALARVPSLSPTTARNVALKAATATNDEKYQNRFITAANKVAEFQTDPEHTLNTVAAAAGHIEHPGVKQALMSTSLNALGFLASKLPQPLYKDAVSKASDINNVSDTQRDTFMRYVEAVNNPKQFFQDLSTGNATPEQAETAKTLMPTAFGIAQEKAVMTFGAGKVKASYQVRLNVQRMLDLNIEPIASPGLQSFLSQSVQASSTFKQQASTQAAGSKGAPSASNNLKSPLSNLKI